MTRLLNGATACVMLLVAGAGGNSQTAVVNPSGQRIVVMGQEAAPVAVADTRKLTDKQRVLANQANKLVEMATELKTQVDMTNKNILSMTVVRKAEEIELYAHHIRDQAKK